MTCPSCEQPVEDAALFCGNCGFHVRQETAPALSAEVTTVAAASAPAPAATAPVSGVVPVAAVPVAPTAVIASQPAASAQSGQSPQPIPGYAVPPVKPAESQTLELVLSIVSIPAALFPVVGFALSIPALVLARKHKAVAPTVLSIIGIVLAVAVVILNIFYYVAHPEERTTKSSSTVIVSPLSTLSN